jgi:hypothetical protein
MFATKLFSDVFLLFLLLSMAEVTCRLWVDLKGYFPEMFILGVNALKMREKPLQQMSKSLTITIAISGLIPLVLITLTKRYAKP